MNEVQSLTADEMLESIFQCMNKLLVEKDFSKSIILLTELGKTLTNAHRASFWYNDVKNKQYWTLAASGTERITIPAGTGIVGASIENNETNVMTALIDGECKTVALSEMIESGEIVHDPKIPDLMTSNAYVSPDNPLLDVAYDMGIYIGEQK